MLVTHGRSVSRTLALPWLYQTTRALQFCLTEFSCKIRTRRYSSQASSSNRHAILQSQPPPVVAGQFHPTSASTTLGERMANPTTSRSGECRGGSRRSAAATSSTITSTATLGAACYLRSSGPETSLQFTSQSILRLVRPQLQHVWKHVAGRVPNCGPVR